MTLGELVAPRMKEIMERRGMKPTDFVRRRNDKSEENLKKITSSRFYEVLNGKNKNPKVDFIEKFCDIAGVNSMDFFTK